MASHFDESQMYWILKDDPKVKLIDKSHVLDTRDEDGYLRSERIRWRYSRVHVLPITPSETLLSKLFLTHDSYIRQDHAHRVLDPELRNLKIKDNRYTSHAIREYFLNPSWAKTKGLIRTLRNLSPYVETYPLKFLENRSREFAHYAKSMFGQKERPLLLINSSMNDKFNLVLRGPNEFWERLPFMNHGLNQYVTRNVIAFLAAIQISNGLKGFLQARIPNYDPDLDHLADVCNQSVCRTAVRNPASLSEVWVIVRNPSLQKSFKSVADLDRSKERNDVPSNVLIETVIHERETFPEFVRSTENHIELVVHRRVDEQQRAFFLTEHGFRVVSELTATILQELERVRLYVRREVP
jgi:hypothetical protein